MANTIIGRVLLVGPIEEIPTRHGGQSFQKRSLVLDCSRFDQFTGQKYENYPQIEFASKNVSLLDGLIEGEIVEVSFALQGRSYTKDGTTRFFTSIVGYNVEARNTAQEQPVAQQAPQSAPAPQPVPQNNDLPF